MKRNYNPQNDEATSRPRKNVTPLPQEFKDDIREAVNVMRRGGIILYPTDTIWGLGCDATNEEAVRRIFEIKCREDSKALITLVDSEAKIQFYVREIPDVAWDLIEMSNKPLTVVYDGARNLAKNLIAQDGSVAIRLTNEPFSRELCMRMKCAVVSTSANISGMPAPHCFSDISDEIKMPWIMFAHHVAMKRRIRLHRQSSSWGPTLKSKSSVLDSLKAGSGY